MTHAAIRITAIGRLVMSIDGVCCYPAGKSAIRRDADISNKGRAAIAVAPHSSLFVVDEYERDPLERRVILQ